MCYIEAMSAASCLFWRYRLAIDTGGRRSGV